MLVTALAPCITQLVIPLKQFWRFRPERKIQSVQGDAQQQVQQQDDDERIDEGGGGGAADAFGARIAMKAAIAADQRNGGAEEQALEHAGEQIEIADEMLRVLQVLMRVDAQ